MGIRKRGTTWQINKTYKGRRTSASVGDGTAATYHLAVAKEAELLADLVKETQAVATVDNSWTLSYAIQRCYEGPWAKVKTRDKLKSNAERSATFFGKSTKLSEIDENRIDEYIQHLSDLELAGATINRHLSALSKVFREAKRRGGCVRRPDFPRQAETGGRIRWISSKEEQTILSLLERWSKLDERDFILVLVDTGMRTSEALRIAEEHVEWETGLVLVPETKNGSERSVPMSGRVKEILKRRFKAVGRLAFPFHEQWLRHTWERLRSADHMNLEEDRGFVPHCLRHTAATRYVQAGVHLRTLCDIMGWKTIQMAMRYAHLAPKDLVAAVGKVEAMFHPSAEKSPQGQESPVAETA